MTPKLYEEVAAKLASVWGDYAGWAHSVCDAEAGSVRFPDVYPQVLFASDLRSFADYGAEKRAPANGTGLLTPEDTPEPTPTTKRKRGRAKVEMKIETTSDSSLGVISATTVVEETYDDCSSALTLAERVKRRRRTKA